jgi:hypothetical protein
VARLRSYWEDVMSVIVIQNIVGKEEMLLPVSYKKPTQYQMVESQDCEDNRRLNRK